MFSIDFNCVLELFVWFVFHFAEMKPVRCKWLCLMWLRPSSFEFSSSHRNFGPRMYECCCPSSSSFHKPIAAISEWNKHSHSDDDRMTPSPARPSTKQWHPRRIASFGDIALFLVEICWLWSQSIRLKRCSSKAKSSVVAEFKANRKVFLRRVAPQSGSMISKNQIKGGVKRNAITMQSDRSDFGYDRMARLRRRRRDES